MPDLPGVIPSLSAFGGHWVAALVLFVVLFAALAFVFARDRVGFLVLGFARTAGSIFSSPFVFLRRTILRLADFGDRGDAEYRPSRLYLVNKLLLVLHALLIITALSGLAATLIAAWFAFLPPEYVRQAKTAIEARLSAERSELQPLTARVKQFDDEWQAKRQALVDKFKSERQQKADAAAKANRDLEATAPNNPDLASPFTSIHNYLAQVNPAASERELDRHHQSVVDFSGRLTLDEALRNQLVQYADNWRTERVMRAQLAGLSEEALRAQVQPEYPVAVQQANALTERIRSDEQELERVNAEMKYSPGAALFRLLVGLFGFIVTVWMMGLFIEGVSLLVHVADDVRKLREAGEHTAAKASAPSSLPALS